MIRVGQGRPILGLWRAIVSGRFAWRAEVWRHIFLVDQYVGPAARFGGSHTLCRSSDCHSPFSLDEQTARNPKLCADLGLGLGVPWRRPRTRLPCLGRRGVDVFVSALTIENFKRIAGTRIPLTSITVVVGGNNSGKSCVLQAPHFAVNLLQATVIEGDPTIPAQNLRYVPTGDILDLPHGERLTAETSPVRVTFELKDNRNASESRSYAVGFTRGEGLNVRIDSSSDDSATTLLSDYTQPFSIYVPGLAGIPLREEFRSDAIIASAIARGDANLYLRNVLLRISSNEGNCSPHRALPLLSNR